jgi:hypothetical protein
MLFEPIFAALQSAGVRYLTAGGLATVFHGYVRLTGDVDIIVALEPDNCNKAIRALVNLGFSPTASVDPFDFAGPEKRRDWIENKGLTVFSLHRTGGTPLEVDLFVEEPMNFEPLWEKRADFTLGDVVVHVIDKESLIRLKRESGRAQDLEDVAALEKL